MREKTMKEEEKERGRIKEQKENRTRYWRKKGKNEKKMTRRIK